MQKGVRSLVFSEGGYFHHAQTSADGCKDFLSKSDSGIPNCGMDESIESFIELSHNTMHHPRYSMGLIYLPTVG